MGIDTPESGFPIYASQIQVMQNNVAGDINNIDPDQIGREALGVQHITASPLVYTASRAQGSTKYIYDNIQGAPNQYLSNMLGHEIIKMDIDPLSCHLEYPASYAILVWYNFHIRTYTDANYNFVLPDTHANIISVVRLHISETYGGGWKKITPPCMARTVNFFQNKATETSLRSPMYMDVPVSVWGLYEISPYELLSLQVDQYHPSIYWDGLHISKVEVMGTLCPSAHPSNFDTYHASHVVMITPANLGVMVVQTGRV